MLKKNNEVLALKYRPQVFDDLIGQEVISKAIYNSIKLEKTPNAYLFTGIRGVGKTTIARIIAKSLNCINGVDKVCKKDFCDSCKSIINSNHIDVLEMDAASRTGVDDVRELIEFSRYGPASAKYKIFIIDEVHMLSKQAFNALLKTLEEPPSYLKFIFATTEIRKIPVTVISRCQRYDLLRIKNDVLLNYVKKIKELEKGFIDEDVLKLIVKISEGSVRDALSLLDRAILSQPANKNLNLEKAQEIFGYFDKSVLIDIFEHLIAGEEDKVINIYRSIYEAGVEPKIFINDFLEILYYFKNIDLLKHNGTNFNLNDNDFIKIKKLSEKINKKVLLLFWEFTIKTLDEINLVSNQNLSIEMFLSRLMYVKNYKEVEKDSPKDGDILVSKRINNSNDFEEKSEELTIKKDLPISQIRNVSQEEKIISNNENNEQSEKILIKSFDNLIEVCKRKKEIALKYELETNVNLINFASERLDISFNENLDKEFVKNLSKKLYEWTGKRWIITLSKKAGDLSVKQNLKNNLKNLKSSILDKSIYKNMIESFPDAELKEVKEKKDS